MEAHIGQKIAGLQPSNIFEPMSNLVVGVPRSMAPVLCIAACEAVGGEKAKALPAASALHLIHVATYTHEYLQVSDRPNRPMAHHGFGPKIELQCGDTMVPIGYELLAAMEDEDAEHSDRILRVMIELGRGMGAKGMVNGQYLKMKSLGLFDDAPCDDSTAYECFEKLGGALYSCGAACGAILGGGSEEEIEKLRRYGLFVGMIHNIMVRDVLGRDKKFVKFADSLRFLALKELEGMKDKNTERISGIMDGFSAFIRVQKYQFPSRA